MDAHATRDFEQIAREILEQADAVDAEEDERFGDARGDELPRELSTVQGGRGWLREAKRRLDERRAAEARAIPRSRPERLREAKQNAQAVTTDNQIVIAAEVTVDSPDPGTSSRWSPPRARSSSGPAFSRRRRWCWPTPARPSPARTRQRPSRAPPAGRGGGWRGPGGLGR